MTQPVEEGDYNGLVAVMGHLMAVKDRQTVTDEMFEPLKQTIELLKTYGQEMPEEVHTQLQVKLIVADTKTVFFMNRFITIDQRIKSCFATERHYGVCT